MRLHGPLFGASHQVDVCDIEGINIPNEVAVIGVDNEEFICELTNPPMTSIARNFDKAGYQAIELLTNLMAGKENRDRNIIVEPSNVVVRQSTNTLAIEDENVTEALRFIYSSSFERYLCVDDVAIAVATSKRGLYQKFMQILGHSVHEEINRVRTDRIMQLLIETSVPVSKIAFKLGFSGPDHISRYFRARKGMSTLEFRKHHQRF